MAVFLLLLACPLSGFAENVTRTTGTTGQCTWTLEGTVLTISGNGKMGDYNGYNNTLPWGKHQDWLQKPYLRCLFQGQ